MEQRVFMKCKRTELGDLFPFYLNGDLRSDQEQMIEDHLAQCTTCQEELLFWIALAQQGLPAWKPDARRGTSGTAKRRPSVTLTTRN